MKYGGEKFWNLYQMINLMKLQFRRRILKVSAKQNPEMPIVVIFFDGARQNGEFLYRTTLKSHIKQSSNKKFDCTQTFYLIVLICCFHFTYWKWYYSKWILANFVESISIVFVNFPFNKVTIFALWVNGHSIVSPKRYWVENVTYLWNRDLAFFIPLLRYTHCR